MFRSFIAVVLVALLYSCNGSTSGTEVASSAGIQVSHVFEAETKGYAHYRIPAIVVSVAGTVMVMVEARKNPSGDWGPQDLLLIRSKDGGMSWDEPRSIVQLDEEVLQNEVAIKQGLTEPGDVTYNNIVPIVDQKSGKLHFLFCTSYARAYSMYSMDDGETFSEPVEITETFEGFRKEYDWKVIATGPGHGIQHSNGRLLVPVWLSDGTGGHAHRPSVVSTIFSDDDGKTWERGEIVVRDPDLKNPSETLAAELSDGRVMLNIRHESENHRRAITISKDGATEWSPIRFDDALVEPVCMASLLQVGDALIFTNPDSTEPRDPENPLGSWKRQNLSVQLSMDDGMTWPYKRVIEPGVSGYSDMAAGPDGAIYCAYEDGTPTDRGTHVQFISVARFTQDWIQGSSAE